MKNYVTLITLSLISGTSLVEAAHNPFMEANDVALERTEKRLQRIMIAAKAHPQSEKEFEPAKTALEKIKHLLTVHDNNANAEGNNKVYNEYIEVKNNLKAARLLDTRDKYSDPLPSTSRPGAITSQTTQRESDEAAIRATLGTVRSHLTEWDHVCEAIMYHKVKTQIFELKEKGLAQQTISEQAQLPILEKLAILLRQRDKILKAHSHTFKQEARDFSVRWLDQIRDQINHLIKFVDLRIQVSVNLKPVNDLWGTFKQKFGIFSYTFDHRPGVNDEVQSDIFHVEEGDMISVPYKINVGAGGISFGILNAQANDYLKPMDLSGGYDQLLLGAGKHMGIYKCRVPAGVKEVSLVFRNQNKENSEVTNFSIDTFGYDTLRFERFKFGQLPQNATKDDAHSGGSIGSSLKQLIEREDIIGAYKFYISEGKLTPLAIVDFLLEQHYPNFKQLTSEEKALVLNELSSKAT